MIVIQFELDGKVAYVSNDENILGDLKIYGEEGSEALQTFLRFQLSKRILRKDFHHKFSTAGEVQEAIDEVDKYRVVDGDNISKIDTSDDGYILDILVNKECPKRGISTKVLVNVPNK